MSAQAPQWTHLGDTIRRHRETAGLTQQALADAAGVSLRTVGSYERGDTTPDSGIPAGFRKVARVLGWAPNSIEDILAGGSPTPNGPTPPAQGQGNRDDLRELAGAVFAFVDAARDLGAPKRLVESARVATAELLGWAALHHKASEIGPGVAPADVAEIQQHIDPRR